MTDQTRPTAMQSNKSCEAGTDAEHNKAASATEACPTTAELTAKSSAGDSLATDQQEEQRKKALAEKYGYKRQDPQQKGGCCGTKRKTCC